MTGAGGGALRQEEDRVSGRGATVIFTALILVILALCAASWAVLRPRDRTIAPRTAAAKVGMVDQTLIGDHPAAAEIAARKRRTLESYGWVSQPAGVARIPIEEAMRLVAEGHR